MMPLDFSDLEIFYEALAKAIDTVPDTEREVFLCKLSLLLARELGDVDTAQDLLLSAQNHLEKI